jgi:hypothetical protein
MKISSFSVPLAAAILGLAGGAAYGQAAPQMMHGPGSMMMQHQSDRSGADEGEGGAQTRGSPMMQAHPMGPMGAGMSRGHRGGPQEAMKMLAPVIVLMLDTNSDGMLSLEEVQAFHRRVFNTLDANHDGELTVEELRQGLEMWGGMGRGQH